MTKHTRKLPPEEGTIKRLRRQLSSALAPTNAPPSEKRTGASSAHAGKKSAASGMDETMKNSLLLFYVHILTFIALLSLLAGVIVCFVNINAAVGIFSIFGGAVAGIVSIIKKLLG